MRPGTRRAGGARAGFTLIELMVSVLLLTILVGGLFGAAISLGRVQAASARIDLAQAGARAALATLTRDVQMAGAGARSGEVLPATGDPARILAVQVFDSAVAPDRLQLLVTDPAVATQLLSPLAPPTLVVAGAPPLAAGDVLQIGDLVTAVRLPVLSVTPGGASTTLQVAATNPLPPGLGAGSWVFRSRLALYYVDTPFGAQDPVLMVDPDGPAGPLPPQPVAEGVEDIQVALGFDLDGDGAVRSVGAAADDDEWVHNVANEAAPATLAGLRSVRVTLVVRTVQPGAGALGVRPAVEDHPAAAQGDTYPRRVLRSEIAVRSLNL